jgi:hypothetical protein
VKPAPNPLTPEQVDAFNLYVRVWQERLGLNDWRIVHSRRKTRSMAEVTIHHKARLATYRVGDFGAEAITPESIEATALHELLHVLLAELTNQAEYGIEGEALESAEHRVIHVLEKLLLK